MILSKLGHSGPVNWVDTAWHKYCQCERLSFSLALYPYETWTKSLDFFQKHDIFKMKLQVNSHQIAIKSHQKRKITRKLTQEKQILYENVHKIRYYVGIYISYTHNLNYDQYRATAVTVEHC